MKKILEKIFGKKKVKMVKVCYWFDGQVYTTEVTTYAFLLLERDPHVYIGFVNDEGYDEYNAWGILCGLDFENEEMYKIHCEAIDRFM